MVAKQEKLTTERVDEVFKMSQELAERRGMSALDAFVFAKENVQSLEPQAQGDRKLQAHIKKSLEPVQELARKYVITEMSRIMSGEGNVQKELEAFTQTVVKAGLFDSIKELKRLKTSEANEKKRAEEARKEQKRQEELARTRRSEPVSSRGDDCSCGGSTGCCG
jgi:hypothetical protein